MRIRRWTLAPGESIARAALHRQFGGSCQTGISLSHQTANVFLFVSRASGVPHGYLDSWKDDGRFHYMGQGLRGNQGVRDVRALYGVVQSSNVNSGILVTTAYFTQPARQFSAGLKYTLQLQDFATLKRWLIVQR